MSANEPVAVNILDREFLIACPDDERERLATAARDLDRRMREMRQSMRSATLDRCAILAALNVSHELLLERTRNVKLAAQIEALGSKLDGALEATTTGSIR